MISTDSNETITVLLHIYGTDFHIFVYHFNVFIAYLQFIWPNVFLIHL